MARSHISVLATAILLIVILGASRSASQQGFQSINCGGEAYNDPITKIIWEADPLNKENNDMVYGKVGKVNSSLRDITNVMTTLRYFPYDKSNSKFCYSLQVSNGSTYLLRASFLYGNYDELNQPPNFVLILNYDQWTNVTTSSSTTITTELIFIAKGHGLEVCLAPQLDSSDTPFISTLELRILAKTMYISNFDSEGYGRMLWRRINYGARTNVATRYRDDPYDRIWEADTTGTIVSINTSSMGTYSYLEDPEEPPAEVMATAITTKDSKGDLSFTYDGFGGIDSFLIEMHFQEVAENARGGARILGLEFPNSSFNILFQNVSIPVPSDGPIRVQIDQGLQLPTSLQIRLFPRAGSPRGALLNAIELFRWTPQPLFTIATFQDDVDTIKEIQIYFNLKGYGHADPCMPKSYSWTWISCNQDVQPRIIEINLANFNLTGGIPVLIDKLASLQKLNLSNNMLSGEIPDFSHLVELQSLDLHNNSFNGELPQTLYSLPQLTNLDVSYNKLCVTLISSLILKSFNFAGNTGPCDCLESSCSSKLEKERKKIRQFYFVVIFLGALYLVSVLALLIIYKARHIRQKKEISRSTITTDTKGVGDPESLPFVTRIFTYNEIRNATLDFTTLLGEGGFGKVYHGLLATTGEAIAVKILENASKQGLKEFYNEVAILSRVRHKNLVALIGYCVENTYMLIYEYIAKGNLRNLLYGEVDCVDRPLPWTTRLHIALDASQGLEYLHMGCDSAIIHRDVKSSNILLTHKMRAKVSDFGLSRLKEADKSISHVSTINIAGTIGYLDPVYYATNQFTDKSDVYSFGIVLFELICGRAPIDMFNSLPHIVEWVTPAIMQGNVGDIVDPMLENGYKEESMRKVVDMAFSCVNRDRMKRPRMRQVSQLLQNALEIEIDQEFSAHSHDASGYLSTLTNIEAL